MSVLFKVLFFNYFFAIFKISLPVSLCSVLAQCWWNIGYIIVSYQLERYASVILCKQIVSNRTSKGEF